MSDVERVGALHLEVTAVGAGTTLPTGWVWLCGLLHVSGQPVGQWSVPVHKGDLVGRPRDLSIREAAAQWLVSYLQRAGGEAPVAEVSAAAGRAGISRRTLDRARPAARVRRVPGTRLWRLEEVEAP